MKKILMVFCAVVLTVSAFGCSGKESSDTKKDNNVTESVTENVNGENGTDDEEPVGETDIEDERSKETEANSNRLAGTYWNATGHYEYLKKDVLVEWIGENKHEDRYADVYFNADGTALFRDVEDDKYIYSKRYKWTDDGKKIHLENLDKENWGNEFFAEIRDGVMYFEAFESILRMESAERPLFGSEFCSADLYGSWILTSISDENGMAASEDKGLYSVLEFDVLTTEENGYGMYASFMYEKDGEVVVNIEQSPLTEAVYKDIRFASEDGLMRYEVTFVDDNTLSVSEYDHTEGDAYSNTVTMIFKTYPIKQQYADRVKRLNDKCTKEVRTLTTQEEKNTYAYRSFMEWEELINEILGYLRSKMISTDFENIKYQQMAWAINRQTVMENKAEGAENPDEVMYTTGCKIIMDRCGELIEYIK